jgi:hypothetical protein
MAGKEGSHSGLIVKRWLQQGTQDSTFVCTICSTGDWDCGNKGWQSVEQHMINKKHRDTIKLITNNSTFVSVMQANNVDEQQRSAATLSHPSKTISFQNQATRAEAMWPINDACHGHSDKSCDEAGDLFRMMFPDSKIAEQFSMERTKMSYVISHGLGPYASTVIFSVKLSAASALYYVSTNKPIIKM